MKKLNFFLIIFSSLLSVASVKAQSDNSGIYKTANDFVTGQLSLAINCATEKHKIKLNDFFSLDHITVVHEGKSYDFKKSEVFGFELCGGETYRFSGDNNYLIMNPKEKTILLYKAEKHQTKATATKMYTYYFSKNASSDLQELTLGNLKATFPDDHKFHDGLDADFKSDNDLTSYDSFHKMYKVNHIMMMSEK